MWSLICLQLLVAAAGQVHGVELHLSAVNLMRTDDSLPCGTVRCVDEVDPSNGNSIKSLQLRKQLNREVLVNLNQEDNSFNCKFDGITANGNWTSYKAEAGLTLYNSQDCNDAKFICESVHVNKLGVEHVSSSSGQINYKLQKLESSLADIENKVDTLTKSDYKMQELSSTVADLQSKVEQLTKSDSKIQDLPSSLKSLTKAFSKLQSGLFPTTCPRSMRPPQYKRYQIVYPTDGTPYLCDTDGGWTVIQRRIDGTTNFYRNWYNYKNGFGTFDGDFWLGLDLIHQITSSSNQEIMMSFMYEGKFYYAIYDNFRVSGEEDNYRLNVPTYTGGNAGDQLASHNNQFSTYDKDNDIWVTGNCAQNRTGAWWYNDCTWVNLNGEWGGHNKTGPEWREVTNEAPATMTEMKIRKMI